MNKKAISFASKVVFPAVVVLMFGCRTTVVSLDETEPFDAAALSPELAFEENTELPPPEDILVVEPVEGEDRPLDLEGRYSLFVRDGDLKNVLLALGKESPYNFVIAPEAEGMVTMDMENVPLEVLLEAILEPLDLTYRIEDDLIWIQLPDVPAELFSLNYVITSRSSSRSIGGSSLSGAGTAGTTGTTGTTGGTVGSNLATAGGDTVAGSESMDLYGTLESSLSLFLSEKGKLHISREANLITVIDRRENVRRIGNYLDKLMKTMQRQVLIEAKLVEISLQKDREVGIDWNLILSDAQVEIASRTGDQIIRAALNGNNVQAVLRALTENHQVSVKSSPRVSTMNNQTAMIVLGEEEVFLEVIEDIDRETNQFIRTRTVPRAVTVGVSLSVLPQISEDGYIMMNMHPVVTEKIGEKVGPEGTRVPELSVREVDTVARVKDGQTMMIAGLTMDRHGVTKTGVPYLSGIPFLGRLFRTDRLDIRKIELVIFLTPKIIEP